MCNTSKAVGGTALRLQNSPIPPFGIPWPSFVVPIVPLPPDISWMSSSIGADTATAGELLGISAVDEAVDVDTPEGKPKKDSADGGFFFGTGLRGAVPSILAREFKSTAVPMVRTCFCCVGVLLEGSILLRPQQVREATCLELFLACALDAWVLRVYQDFCLLRSKDFFCGFQPLDQSRVIKHTRSLTKHL